MDNLSPKKGNLFLRGVCYLDELETFCRKHNINKNTLIDAILKEIAISSHIFSFDNENPNLKININMILLKNAKNRKKSRIY